MGNSIQDYAKKINSKITIFDIGSLLAVLIFIGIYSFYVINENKKNDIPVSYIKGNVSDFSYKKEDVRPFASIHGETYTFLWCQGSSRISEKNRVYFENEEQAKAKGLRLSKLCGK